jgi:hypothetical protein
VDMSPTVQVDVSPIVQSCRLRMARHGLDAWHAASFPSFAKISPRQNMAGTAF